MPSPENISKKVILLGHFGVGKTSLVKRFVHSLFSEQYQTTIGVKVDKKTIHIQERDLTLIIWDIEGGQTQTKLPQSYFLGAQGIVYVCDLSRPSTWQGIAEELAWFQALLPKAAVQVVGNKRDLVTDAEVDAARTQILPALHWVSSAKTGEHVEEMFHALGLAMLS